MRKLLMLLSGAIMVFSTVHAQEKIPPYIPETDKAVLQKLDEWSDWKFGMLIHWGTYSELGIVESWSICPEDEGWTQRAPYGIPYYDYVKKYEALKSQFNPSKFNPEKWAKAAKGAGMQYVVFTTKHHDGFCMFDTKQTDYRVTAPDCPFSKDPRSNIAKEVFEAFRKEGLHAGAYFSKPDWHCQDYWWNYFPPKDRHVNYDITKYPDRWKKYKEYTYNQIEELMTGYGKIDILWLDGGWVRPRKQSEKKAADITAAETDGRPLKQDEDIDMAGIAAMARKHQPGLIVVDRDVHGPFENYRTPEQQIPAKPLDYPWETCMTMANSWSYVPNDTYKPVEKIIHNLVDIVAKGGNYLLNVGPGPDGQLHDEAYTTMTAIGDWMNINGDAIYATKAVAPYKDGKVCFTRKKNGNIYAIYLLDKGEKLPATISFSGLKPVKGAKLTMLGAKDKLSWKVSGDGTQISIPAALQKKDWKCAVAIQIPAVE
jgi:alpha-L-fucosidase